MTRMPTQKVSSEAYCPCRSGRKYKNCCISKKFTWVVDEKGNYGRRMKMHPVVEAVFRAQEKKFVRIFGRKPEGDESVLFEMPPAKEIEAKMVEVMMKAGIPPELIYAYVKTGGLMVTEENKDLLPDKDPREWNAAID